MFIFEIQQHDDKVNLVRYDLHPTNPQVGGSATTVEEAYELLAKQRKEEVPVVKDCRSRNAKD